MLELPDEEEAGVDVDELALEGADAGVLLVPVDAAGVEALLLEASFVDEPSFFAEAYRSLYQPPPLSTKLVRLT